MAAVVEEEVWQSADPVPGLDRAVGITPEAAASAPWAHFLDKTAQSALLLVVTKLVAAWALAGLWAVPMQSRWIWGFIPYAGLQTTAAQFRHLAAWSTVVTACVAVVWSLGHFARSHVSSGRLWGAFVALPMAMLLAVLEWWRRFDADHLLTGTWLVLILIGTAVPAVLILGFVEGSETSTPALPANRRAAKNAAVNAAAAN